MNLRLQAVAVESGKEPLGRDAIADTVAARPHRMLIGGEWVAAQSGHELEVQDPATGHRIASVPAGESADIDLAVRAARQSFDRGTWTRLGAAARARIMLKIADLIERDGRELAALETLDNGAPGQLTASFVHYSARIFRYYAGWCDKIGGSVPDISQGEDQYHAFVSHEPVGVVGLITPWNGPLGAASQKISTALAAGCSCVLKPAEETPLSALWLGRLMEEAGVPAGVVNIVTGFGETAGAALAAHADVDKIAFTGSTEVGRRIVVASGGNLKKVTLELGGKSPSIVFSDADLSQAAPGVAMGTFLNSGQICVAGARVYAHRRIVDDLVAAMSSFAKTLRIGSGFEPTTVIGPLISERQRSRVASLVRGALSDRASAIVGGQEVEGAGFFYQPTILTGARHDSQIMREEIFGPVLAVIPFDDPEEVLLRANDTRYGLAAAIWTQNIGVAHRFAKRLRAGTVWVNCQMIMSPEMPFGGYKESGWGRESGYSGVEAYLEKKATFIKL